MILFCVLTVWLLDSEKRKSGLFKPQNEIIKRNGKFKRPQNKFILKQLKRMVELIISRGLSELLEIYVLCGVRVVNEQILKKKKNVVRDELELRVSTRHHENVESEIFVIIDPGAVFQMFWYGESMNSAVGRVAILTLRLIPLFLLCRHVFLLSLNDEWMNHCS